MNILINCSNLRRGGGLQVADSVCGYLSQHLENKYVVVLSSALNKTSFRLMSSPNIIVERYDIKNNWKTILFGRDEVLDNMVQKYQIDSVLTIFGPPRWSPRCKHVCGFARAQLVIPDSPYYSRMSLISRVKEELKNKILGYFFIRGVDVIWTENPYISKKVRQFFTNIRVETITNYYNQVFDDYDKWNKISLPSFDGCTILSVNAHYPHKNMEIAIDTAKIMKHEHPRFKFRFVLTMSPSDFPPLSEDLQECFLFLGRVDIADVPFLYKQSNISFQPTLLECFTATYPEAMRMKIPIVTTDIEFAHGLCGDAAAYYSPLDAVDCAKVIYQVANDLSYQKELAEKGIKQLEKFDTSSARASKLIRLVENCKK